jgi:hypothetical protein
MPDQGSKAKQRSRAAQEPKAAESSGTFPPPGMFPYGTFPFGTIPFGLFPFIGLALPMWCSLFVFPFLDWQRVMLTAWHKALSDPGFAKLSEEEVRTRAKLYLGLYLEGMQFRHDLAEAGRKWQSDWAQVSLEMLKGVSSAVERRARV